ncbi:hypothetical protein GLOTRDRAFT_70507, partial [Gloeophyllum trabeum ATCC 11539]
MLDKGKATAHDHTQPDLALASDARPSSVHVGDSPAADDHHTPPQSDPRPRQPTQGVLASPVDAHRVSTTLAPRTGRDAAGSRTGAPERSADGGDGGDSDRQGAIRDERGDLPADAEHAQTRSGPGSDTAVCSSASIRPRIQSPCNASRHPPALSAPVLLMPRHLRPLLYCHCCRPPSPIVAPTTLHCGHTVCADHVRSDGSPPSSSSAPAALPLLPTCPLPSCSRPSTHQSPAAFTIPPTSRVVYRPAPSISDPPPLTTVAIKVPDPKVDVVVSKVIDLVERMDKLAEEGEDEFRSRSSSRSRPSQRPRKRRRHLHLPDPQAQQRANVPGPSSLGAGGDSSPESLSAKLEKELMGELTCEICYMLLHQPVTTPCQHTFCAKCLQRSLDHSNACPLCRQDLPSFSYFQDHPYNQVLLAIILKAFPETYAERRRSIEEEEKAARLDTPLFVCQLSFPGMPTLLHIFEPRYRLMLRRCLSSPTPLFGMIMPPRSSSIAGQTEYGTMLEIRSVQMLADGRSMVETWGVWRFRILERAIVDGYLVGRIERIDDFAEELDDVDSVELSVFADSNSSTSTPSLGALLPPPMSVPSTSAPSRPPSPTNAELVAICHGFLDQLRHGTAPWVVQRLNNTYGPMPTTASEFSFWMALVLPIDEHEKAKLLPIRSPRLRLRLVVHWIEQLNSNWWFSSGCV